MEKFENQKSNDLTREKLKDMMTLEVKLESDLGAVLEEVKKITGADFEPRSGGYHLTIVGPAESKILSALDDSTIAKLQQINLDIQKGMGIEVKGVGFIDGASDNKKMREADKTKKTAFIALDIPALQAFRANVGLPAKDFHVTLGFVGGDIHMQVIRQEPVQPNSPKMKDITAPIAKKADPRFASIKLPEITWGGLNGKMKERK
jgi:hypothetical protein